MRFHAGLRLLRHRLHQRAYREHADGHAEAAQALWAVVEEIDALLVRIESKRKGRS